MRRKSGHMRPRVALAALAAGVICAGWAPIAGAGAPRGIVLRSPGSGAQTPAPARLSPAELPAEYAPRDFPSRLRDPRLPDVPDGLLWRRLRADQPLVDPLAYVCAPPAPAAREKVGVATDPVTFRILALRVDFLRDSAGSGSTSRDGRFDLRHPDSARVAVDPPPHNAAYFDAHLRALSRYYERQTGGQLRLEWSLYPAEPDSAYHLSDTADYGPWLISNSDDETLRLAERLVRDTFAAADTCPAPPDFRAYDGFILFHAGPDLQGDIQRDSPYDIPSFNIQLAEPVAVQDSTFFIDLIMVMPEYVTQDGYLGALNGVMVHEFGHQLGFFDLYNVLNFFPQVGMFSLMDSGDNLYGTIWDPYEGVETFLRGAIPGSIDPWQKLVIPYLRGGMDPFFVGDDVEMTLEAVQTSRRMAVVPIGGERVYDSQGREYLEYSEYFIAENRPFDLNADGAVYLETDSATGVILGPMNIPAEVTDSLGLPPDVLGAYEQDYLLPGGGLLVWHVDNQAIADGFGYCYGCVNVLPGRRGVDVEEADGIEDLGDIYSIEWTGGQYDYWFAGGAGSLFSPDSDPGTQSSGGGETGISIAALDSTGVSMRVAVARGRMHRHWPIYVGDPNAADYLSSADLDGDGTPEILSAAGHYVLALEPDGSGFRHAGPGGLVAWSDSLWLPGVAAAQLVAGDGKMLVMSAADGGRVSAWDSRAREILSYPPPGSIFPALRFTTAPMVLDSVIVIGDSEGRLRGLVPGLSPELRWRTPTPGFRVTCTAAGDLRGGSTSIVWGNAGGEIYLADGSQRGGYHVAHGWPRSLGEDGAALRALLLLARTEEAPPGAASGGESGLVIAVDEDGLVGVFTTDGALLEGWPRSLDSPPAGAPALGDPDGDGLLEVVATGEDGRIHVWNLRGQDEWYWPRSVWHPDVTPFNALLCGPILIDVSGDGRPEILQGHGDGTLRLLTYEGDAVPGWPAAVGFTPAGGPLVLRSESREGGSELLVAVGDAAGFAALLSLADGDRAPRPGELWRGDVDPGRTRCYPAAWIPAPRALAGLVEDSSLQFTPNPVLGDQGWLRVRMGQPGSLHVRLHDTSGQRVWEKTYHPLTGAQGDLLSLELGALAPGLYVARITAESGEQREQILRKLAIVR